MAELIPIAEGNPGTPAVVLVHGLNLLGSDDHHIDTWRHASCAEGDCWPHWLAQDTGCGVWVARYSSAFSAWADQAMPLTQQADQLCNLLGVEPGLAGRDLICVGHSMGGLLIKKLLENAHAKRDARMQAVAARVKGVVFIATPHTGSFLANLADMASRVLRINAQVSSLQRNDAMLLDLSQSFRSRVAEEGLPVLTYNEGRGVAGMRKLFGVLAGPSVMVVARSDADPGIAGRSAVFLDDEDHVSISRPASRNVQLHNGVVQFIQEIQTRPTLPPPQDVTQPPTALHRQPGRLAGSTDKRLAPREGKVYGRDAEVQRVLSFLRSDAAAAQIVGVAGIGKTEVCRAALKAWLNEAPEQAVFYVQVPDAAGPDALVTTIGRALGHEHVELPPQLWSVLAPGLYYLDNLESVVQSEDGRALLREFAEQPQVRLLASTRIDASGVLGRPIELGVLDEQPALDLFRATWRGPQVLPDDAALRPFVADELGRHALSITLCAQLGDVYGFDELRARWRQQGTAVAQDDTAVGRRASLNRSLTLTARALSATPGALVLWALVALFPTGVDADTLSELEQAGDLPQVRAALRRHRVIEAQADGRWSLLPPLARYALAAALAGRDGFAWPPCRSAMVQVFEPRLALAGRVASTTEVLAARHWVRQRFDATLHLMRLEADNDDASDLPSKWHSALLNLYAFEAAASRDWLAHWLSGNAGSRHPPSAYLHIGGLESRFGQLDAARSHYDHALVLYHQVQDGVGEANTLQALGDLERHLGGLDAARAHYDHALSLFRKERDGLGEANTLKALGDLERHLGELDIARTNYQRALRLYRQEQEIVGEANTLQALGDLERRLGGLDTARTHYEQALALFRKEQDDQGEANTLKVLGDLERHLGRLDTARVHYEQALGLCRRGRDGLGEANILQALGHLEHRLGGLDTARTHFEHALGLYRKEQGGLGEADTLKALGDLDRQLGGFDTARIHYDRALDLYRKWHGGLGEANTVKALGDLERFLGALETARAHYEQALGLFRKEQDGLGEANTVKALGDLERHLGALAAARTHYDRALVLYRKARDSLGEANTWLSLGGWHLAQQQWSDALVAYQQARALYQGVGAQVGLAFTCTELLRNHQVLGMGNERDDLLMQALDAAVRSHMPNVVDHVRQVAMEVLGSDAALRAWLTAHSLNDSDGAPV